MSMIWKRRTAVLFADELIATEVQLKNDVLYIQVSSEADEWSQFALRHYEISFLSPLKYKVLSSQRQLPPEEEPALMILYDRSGVIAMSVVLKNRKEFDFVFSWVKDHFKMHVNVISKNSYLQEKFEQLPLDYLVPKDYYVEGTPQLSESVEKTEEREELGEPESNIPSTLKFKAFQSLSGDLRDNKILISSLNGCQIFSISRRELPFNAAQTEEKRSIETSSLKEFLKGYCLSVFKRTDMKSLLSLAFFYLCLILLQVFGQFQLAVCGLALAFAIVKYDLWAIKKSSIENIQKPVEASPIEELYAKRLVSFGRSEVADFLSVVNRTIRLHAENSPQKNERSTR